MACPSKAGGSVARKSSFSVPKIIRNFFGRTLKFSKSGPITNPDAQESIEKKVGEDPQVFKNRFDNLGRQGTFG
jgi:hypothetical protein